RSRLWRRRGLETGSEFRVGARVKLESAQGHFPLLLSIFDSLVAIEIPGRKNIARRQGIVPTAECKIDHRTVFRQSIATTGCRHEPGIQGGLPRAYLDVVARTGHCSTTNDACAVSGNDVSDQ